MDMPIYKLIVNDDDSIGFNYVAFVDKPATAETWMAFAEQKENKIEFKEVDSERGIVMGALMVANLPIPRIDEKTKQPFLVVLDAENIDKAMAKNARLGFRNNVNEMHDPKKKVEGVYMQYSWPINKEIGMPTPIGFNEVPDGSVFAIYKVDNPEIRQKIKDGTFKGFSIEGKFLQEPILEMAQEDQDLILDALKGSNLK